MGFRKRFEWDRGECVGWVLSSFILDFGNLFNFAKCIMHLLKHVIPLHKTVMLRMLIQCIA